jgi:uncharacterized damage-inducible protein DinB
MFDHNRSRVLEILEDVTDEMLDFTPDSSSVESIASLLYHIAGVEWSWVFEDLDGREMDYEIWKYAFALRDFHDIEQLTGKPKQFYLDLILRTREEIMDRLKEFEDHDLTKEFTLSDNPDITFTLEYVLFHLINHEALHLGQISLLKRLYRIHYS